MRLPVLERGDAGHQFELVVEMRYVLEPGFICYLRDAEIRILKQFVCKVNPDFKQAVEYAPSCGQLEIPA